MVDTPFTPDDATSVVAPVAPPAVAVAATPAAPPAPPAPVGAPAGFPQQNVTVNVAAPAPIVVTRSSGPSMVVRAAWYLFVGWWLTGIAIVAGYVAALTILGLPIAFYVFNRIPSLLTLRPRNTTYVAELRDGMMMLTEKTSEQLAMWIRAIWFVAAGWWIGAIWMGIAYLLCLTVLGIPLGLMMFNRVGGVMTLLRY